MKLHLYGKGARPGRKMGHLTALAPTAERPAKLRSPPATQSAIERPNNCCGLANPVAPPVPPISQPGFTPRVATKVAKYSESGSTDVSSYRSSKKPVSTNPASSCPPI